MPVDQHSDSGSGPFEDRLSAALHRAGDTFDTDRAALSAGGAARGRHLRLRRRAAVAGGAAGLALVGMGGALLVPWGGTPAPQPTSVAANPKATPGVAPREFTGAELIRTLESLLPAGEFSNQEARGTHDQAPLPPAIRLTFDDGKGAGSVAVGLYEVRPGGQNAVELATCPDKVLRPYDSCSVTRIAGGATLRTLRTYEYPDRRVDTKLWMADLVTRTGQHVSVSEWNAATEKDAPVSRPEPPLTAAQLSRLARADVWLDVIDAIPKDPGKPAAEAGQDAPAGPTVEAVLNTLVPLLPKDVEVVTKGAGYTFVVLDDGKGKSYVQIDVQPRMGDVAHELFGSGAETLADGTKVASRQGPGDKGVDGGVMWTVDTLRTDGTRVVISAFNAGNQHDAPTRETPALTMEQLRKIAVSPKWRELL